MRAIVYGAFVHAIVALSFAVRRAPSLRPARFALTVGLGADVLLLALRDVATREHRALYHLAQWAHLGALAAAVSVVLAWIGRRGDAWALYALFALCSVVAYPDPALPLYVAAQGAAVVVMFFALGDWIQSRQVAGPAQLAGLVVLAAETLVLVAPFGAAWLHGTELADEWGAALPIRLVEYLTLSVVGWRAWRTAGSSQPSDSQPS